MPLLRNVKTGNLEFVGDLQAAGAVEGGTHAVDPGHPVSLAPSPGATGAASSSEQLLSLGSPVQPEAERRAADEAAYEAARYSGPGEAGAAFVTGIADAATLGGFSAANRLGGDDAARSLRQHQGAYTGGQIVGAIATGRPTSPTLAGAASRLGSRVAAGGGIGRKALGFGIEGTIQGGGQGFAQALLQDDLSLERVVSSIGSGALIGGGTGAGLGLLGGVISKARQAAQAATEARGPALAADDAAAALEGSPAAQAAGVGRVVDDVPAMDIPDARVAERAELDRIAAEREVEGHSIVGELEAARKAAKAERPWIALEGFKKGSKDAIPEAAPIEAAGPKTLTPKPLSTKVQQTLFDEPSGEGLRRLRLRVTTRNSAYPDFAKTSDALTEGAPTTTYIEVQERVGKSWETVGSSSVRHRGADAAAVNELNVIPKWADKGLEGRMLAAAERRLGRRLIADDAAEQAHIDDLLGTRRGMDLQRQLRRAGGVPTFQQLQEAGADFIEKTVPMSQIMPRVAAARQVDAAAQAAAEAASPTASKVPQLAVTQDGQLVVTSGFQRLQDAAAAGEKRLKVAITPAPAHWPPDTAGARLFPDARLPVERVPRGAAAGRRVALPAKTAAEFNEIAKVSFKADKKIDRLLENPKGAAANPKRLLDALHQQEHALQRLEKIEPELRTRLARQQRPGRADNRLNALDTLKANLERNRRLQARVNAVLADPDTPRLQAIRAQREDLAAAAREPKSLVQSLTEGAAFAGATALSAPLGLGAPIVGARVAQSVGRRLFGGMRKAGTAAAKATTRALDAFTAAGKAARPAAVPLATRTLGTVRFAPESKERKPARPPAGPTPRKDPLADSFLARRAELLDQVEMGPSGQLVMRQDARARLGAALAGVGAFSPELADRLETAMAARIEFLAEKLPKRPDMGGMQIGPDLWRPSSIEMRTFARYVAAAEDPSGIEQRFADNTISPEDAETYRVLYPDRFGDFMRQLSERLAIAKQGLPAQRRYALTILTGVPIDPALTAPILTVLQGAHSSEPGTSGGAAPPTPQPQFGSIKAEEPTRSQARGK